MKNNKKVNLAEAAAQVMGGLPAVDMLGKPNMDASGKGSFTATPVVAAAPATLAGIGKPGVPATMSAMAGGAKAAAPVQNTETEAEEGSEDNKKKVEESFRLAISELLGEDVDENLVSKLEAIFEAAVSEKVEMEVASVIAQLDENAKEYLGNVTESLVEKVDDYLDYVVEEWVKENAIAVEQGIKTQIAENFITGLKNLFENHYIDVPAEKYNVLDDIYEQNQKLQAELNESVKAIIDLKKQVSLTECAGIFVAETKDLADTQITKLQNLMENVSFGTPEEYRDKLVAIKENYLRKPTSTPTRVVDVEETFSKTPHVPTTLVEGYVNAIGRINKKA